MSTRLFHGRLECRLLHLGASFALLAVVMLPKPVHADEGGVSYWLPGRFSSLAAAPTTPGWSMAAVYYHATLTGGGEVAAARQVQIGKLPAAVNVSLNANLNAQADLVLLNPTYTFATPVLGGQLAIGATGMFGRSNTGIDGTLTTSVGQMATTRTGVIGDSITSVGDLYPQATLKWNAGVHNYMAYVTGDIPVGAYDSTRLANLGIGHAAFDAGGGYTYFNPASGHELSAVAGLTYNFKNQDTNYQNGIDLHVDWAASQFLSKQVFVGLVGYGYQQITDDVGAHPALGGFRSRVLGIGPQIGFLFPVGDMQGFLNLKGYGEFEAANRASGWNAWLTFVISPVAPVSTVASTRRVAIK